MKRLLILLFMLANLYSNGQAKLEMSLVHVFTPANANSPSSSVTYSSTVNLTVFVKNTGNAAYSGSISVMAKRDTIGGVFLDSLHMITLVPLLPNDSLQVPLSFIPSPGPNAFKVAGNGNTIVVWPFVSGALLGDSLRSTVWVTDVISLKEIEQGMFRLFPNPTINQINIKPIKPLDYKKIIVYDVFARKVKEIEYSEIVDVSELKSGSYWIIIYSDTSSYKIPFIKQ